jgi:hypothetical protein
MSMLGNVNPLPQRQGVKTRQIFYPNEPSLGVDPVAPIGYVMDLLDEAGFGTSQGLTRVPVYKGRRRGSSTLSGDIMAEGENPFGLEARIFPRILKSALGDDGYVRPKGGTSKLHRLFTPILASAEAGSAQIQDESLETPVIYTRNKGVRIGSINMTYAGGGAVARYGMNAMGIGREVNTSLGGTIVEYPFRAFSFMNGYARLAGYYLTGMTDFSITMDFGVSRQDAAFHAGEAAAIGYGDIALSGRLGLMWSTSGAAPENNMNFYNMAVNQQNIPLDVGFANAPVDLADQWVRFIIPATRFSRRGFRPGGAAGKTITQDWQHVDDVDSDLPAENLGEIRGPYALTTDNKLAIKVDGGAAVSVTLGTASTTVTVTDVVAAINANGTLNTAIDAVEYFGRVLLRHKLLGASHSIQIDTAALDSAHAILGFDGIASTGFDDTPWLIEVFSDIAVDL